MTLPKRCFVIACERRPMCSRSSAAAGEIRVAKSASDNFDFAMLSRTEPASASRDRFTSAGSGSELNSETKLTQTSYQSGGQSRDAPNLHHSGDSYAPSSGAEPVNVPPVFTPLLT